MTFRPLAIALGITGLLGLPGTLLAQGQGMPEEHEHESGAPPATEGSPPQGGMMGMQGGQGMPGQMGGGASTGMAEMQAQMKALHEHSMKMEGIHDPDALMAQMRVHMRMMDEMMQAMLEHQATPPPPKKPMGHM